MNVDLKKVDNLMKKQHIKFSVACKAYKLIRRGTDVNTALVIANAREGKELLKQQRKDSGMKRKNEKSLEQLVAEMGKKADFLLWVIYGDEPLSSLEVFISDAMCLEEELDELNLDPGSKNDALDYCYSNTDGAEVLFK